jgi:protein-S-isoprenylcysteine O-methyltransferase Ste14
MGIFWLVLAILIWGIIHSILASLQFKDFTRRLIGPSADRFYRLAYNLFAGISFLPVLATAALVPDRRLYAVSFPWSLLMVLGEFLAVLALAAGVLQTDAWQFIGLRQVVGTGGNQPGGLITKGLYRFVRHPLYSAGLVFIWLVPVMTVNLLAINIALSVYIFVGATFEERKLRREFGQDYANYAAATPMFIPFLKGNKIPRKSS